PGGGERGARPGAPPRRAHGGDTGGARRLPRAAGGARRAHSRQRRRHPARRSRRDGGGGRPARARARPCRRRPRRPRRPGEGPRRGARRLSGPAPRRDRAPLLEARRGRDRLLAHARGRLCGAAPAAPRLRIPARTVEGEGPMPFWHRIVIAGAVFLAVSIVARLIDMWLARRPLAPEAVTRYRVLRRTVSVSILVVGFFSALLVIPEVRAVAGGLLASSAVLGVIIGFASQRTLGNFVAGLLIAITQPVRLGDRVSYGGEDGVIEEIGLTYTFIRTQDQARLVVPNEKLASDTIRNSTIRSRE